MAKKKPLELMLMSDAELDAYIEDLGKSEERLATAMLIRDCPAYANLIKRIAAHACKLSSTVKEASALSFTDGDEVAANKERLIENIRRLKAKIDSLPNNEHGAKLKLFYGEGLKKAEVELLGCNMTPKMRKLTDEFGKLKQDLQVMLTQWNNTPELQSHDIFQYFPVLVTIFNCTTVSSLPADASDDFSEAETSNVGQ
jgi:hypothetical protein